MFQLRLSMLSKIVLSMIPMMGSMVLVSFSIYRDGFENNEDADRAVHMVDITGRQEREMIKMSEALRGYLLNPKNTKEFERKKEADENYAKYSEELKGLVKDSPEILALNEEMAKFDEEELDAKENKVAELIQTDLPAALDFYATSYSESRKKQGANFEKLKGLVKKHSQKILVDIQADKRHSAEFTLLILGLGAVIGFFCTWFIALTVTRSASKVFTGIMQLSDSLLTSSESVSNQSSSLSESTQEEASAVQRTASSMDEISAMIAKNEENTRQSLQSSEASRHSVDQGQSAMAEMLGSMSDLNSSNESISTQIQESNHRVAEIVQIIQEIGSKTQVIHDIVFQTRLLSFNASVEAARAGEAGKGFAVVAEEVGNLAKMSGQAAEEIGKLLTASRSKVEQVVKENEAKTSQFLSENKQKVDLGIQTAARCQESLTQIGHSVSQLDSVLGEISTASAEQSKGIVEIENALQTVNSLTQQNVQIAQQSSATSDELREQAVNLRGSVESLVKILLGREMEGDSAKRAA